jgi:hypothetical protein
MGTVNGDAGAAQFFGQREMKRMVLGVQGQFEAIGCGRRPMSTTQPISFRKRLTTRSRPTTIRRLMQL